MLSRRWDPSICVGDWLITEVQDRDPDGWKQGFHSDQLGIDLGFNKEILGSLRKCKIWIDWCWATIIIKTESSNYKGCTLDCDFSILFLFIVEIVRNTQRFGVIGAWRLWYFWDWRSESINLQRYGFIGKYLMREDTDNWGQYKRILNLIVDIMTQSQLLNHSEELKNGEGTHKRLKISVAHFDNSALIKTYSKTLIGRCMNPEEQEMKALFTNLPKIWELEERVTSIDLGFGKFQFDFKTEEDFEAVLKQQPFHFDYWMLSLARWQPKQSKSFPSEIMFWIQIIGVPLEFRTVPTFESIGGALERTVAVDLVHNRVQVAIDAFKEMCFETTVDFKGGEFYDGEEYDGEEVVVSFHYENLFGYCKLCASLCHKEELCPLEPKNSKMKNGGSSDRAKHDDRARSYKGMVINGNMGQQNKERDGREYYGKGKGKMGDSEDSLYKSARREDARNGTSELGFGGQEAHNITSSGQSRADEGQRAPPKEDREEGEIKNNGEDDTMLPSTEFQLELAKTQAEGTEVTVESTDEEKVLLMVSGMVEKQDDIAEDLGMEIEAINATLMESGTLLQEEAEQASRAQEVRVHTQEEEEMVCGEADIEKDTGAAVLETRQGNRKRLFKPSLSTAGSTKMRLASALLSPRKRASAKMGPRHGDSRKPLESKGSLNPKLANLKF
ncbi:hypothetical protein Bca52824_039680 [Brassica carinata]|uniref:DUF4283 domain-containing protein n=1 Tax=Brassica carinata TaxID=52824 RepID=A0A8X7UX44_BRACI|nr:hypothetical protein Bca52824_039680 [Brassica carinata]